MGELNKPNEALKKPAGQEMEIPKSAILKLKELEKYSKDFVSVLLPRAMYKPSEAISIVKNYFKE